MSLEDIVLPTNKTETKISNNRRKIRTGEAGLSIKVTVVDANDQPYNLTDFDIVFSEQKDQGKVVVDDGSDEESGLGGSFVKNDPVGGTFTYTLAKDVYGASGRCWFALKKGEEIIDTTKDFYFDVLKDVNIHFDNNTYVSSLASLETHYDGVIKKAKEDSEALLTKINDQLSQALADNNKRAADSLTDQKAQLQKLIDSTNQLQTDWNIQKAAIQKAADDQLKANKDANDAEIADVKKQLADELAKIDQSQFVSLNNMITALRTDSNNLKQEVDNLKNKNKDIVNPNLITGSKDFTGSKWVNIPENVQKDKYLDFTAICVNWAWNGISQYIAVNKGETFTASMYVKAPAGSKVSWFLSFPDNENNYKRADINRSGITITAAGDWQRTSITFTITSDSGAIKPRIENGDNGVFWIAGMKLERGTVATPWCPAYEDYAMKSDLDALKAEIDQLKQSK